MNKASAQQPELILPIGHTEDIYRTEYIAEGKFILTCAYDNTAKLWDVYSGKLLHTFPGLLQTPEHIVNSGNTTLLSDDQRYLVALTVDGYLKKWELPSAKLLYAIKAGNTNLAGLEYSAGGKYLLLKRGWTHSEIDAEIRDGSNGRVLHTFREKFSNYQGMGTVQFSPDGKYILLRSDSSLYLYRPSDRSIAFKAERIENFNSSVFSPDGKYVIINPRRSNRLRLLQTSDGLMRELFISGTVEFSPDSRYVLSKNDAGLLVIDVESGAVLHRLDKTVNEYMDGHFSADGKHIFLSRNPGFIRGTDPYDSVTHIWETSSGKHLLTLQGQDWDINDVVLSPGNRFVATISAVTQLWETATGKLVNTLDGRNVVFGPDERTIAVTGKRSVKIFSMRINDTLAELKGHSNPLVKAVFDRDSKQVLTLSNDNSVKLWDISKGRMIKNFEETSTINDAAFSKDGKNILLVTDAGKAIVKETNSGQTILLLSANTAAYSPDGSRITITTDSTFSIRDAVSGKELFGRQENYLMNDAALSDDGKYAYYIFGQSAVAVIELFTGRTFKNYLGEEDITRCRFSPDSRYFFILGKQGSARIIETATGKLAAQFSERSETEYGVTHLGGYYYQNLWQSDFDHFSPDGKWLLFRTYMDQYVVMRNMKDLAVVDTIYTRNALAKNAAFIPGTDQFITGTADDKIRIWSKGKTGYVLSKEFPGNGFKLSPDGKWLLIINKVQLQFYDLQARRFRTKALAIQENDYFIQLADKSYYAASKNALQSLLFRMGDRYLSFEQFDIQLNRPDLVLAAMQYQDPALIKAYRKAYEKRIKRSGIDSSSFKTGYNFPSADFVNREAIRYEQESGRLTLSVKGADGKYPLDRFNIWVNEVPVYGQQGISLRKRKARYFDTTVNIQLSAGKNQLYTSITNIQGIESYRVPLMVHYTPAVKPAERVYFIGIGIDKFADTKRNLQYSSKDIRDLSRKLKEKHKDNISIDTLFNESVTVDAIKALKQKLQQTTADDRVIISYSGHGLLGKDFDYYLSTYAINFDKPEQHGLPYEELENLLDNIPARKKLLLIDACHSGEVDKEELIRIEGAENSLELVRGVKPVALKQEGSLGMQNSFELMQSLFVNVGRSTGATIISAAAGTQFAMERGDLKNGVFTYSILEALDKNPTIKISELKKIVGERVEQLTHGLQKPTSRNEMIAVDWSL